MDKLAKKTLYRSTLFPVFLGILTFVPAGSLNFWQAWLYCLIFLVVE